MSYKHANRGTYVDIISKGNEKKTANSYKIYLNK